MTIMNPSQQAQKFGFSPLNQYPHRRLRRLRQNAALRHVTAETHLLAKDLIAPIFIVDGVSQKQPIASMPEVYRFSIDTLIDEAKALYDVGVCAVNLFPCLQSSQKDSHGSASLEHNALAVRAIEALSKALPSLCIIVDVALDPFTDHGHDGLIDSDGVVLNDETIEILVQMALHYAAAGATVIAPSDMMDGRVGAIRRALDSHRFNDVAIMSYAAKYASAFYGPFREALSSAPRFGNKYGYQMNPANVREALLECHLDEGEGADILMVKPALPYLDVLCRLRQQTLLPLAAFHVSGEYAMVQAAAQNGWVDGPRAMMESLLSIKRAGADMILTWAAHSIAKKIDARR